MGFAVADGVDASNGGTFDILVGTPGYDGKGGEDAGCVQLVSGRSTSKNARIVHEREGSSVGAAFGSKAGEPMYTLPGDAGGGLFGHDVVALGQWRPIDGPGDFTVSRGAGPGSVTVFSGVDGATLHVFEPVEGDGRFGWSLGAADLDRDGISELVAGVPGHIRSGGTGHGSSLVRVCSGKDRTQLVELRPGSTEELFATAVSTAGNFGAGGFTALAASADQSPTRPGSVQVFTTSRD